MLSPLRAPHEVVATILDSRAREKNPFVVSLDGRSDAGKWHARWDAAEDHYFTYVAPPNAFDLVVHES